MICGGIYHGQCDNRIRCTNCGDNHKSNFRKCREFIFNYQLKKTMAERNLSAYEAANMIKGNRSSYDLRYNNKEWPMAENGETAVDKNIIDGRNQTYANITSRYLIKESSRNPSLEVKRKEKEVHDQSKKKGHEGLHNNRKNETRRIYEEQKMNQSSIEDRSREDRQVSPTIEKVTGNLRDNQEKNVSTWSNIEERIKGLEEKMDRMAQSHQKRMEQIMDLLSQTLKIRRRQSDFRLEGSKQR